MSKGLLLAMLATLVILLGVMSYVVGPKPKPGESPEDQAKMKTHAEAEQKQTEERDKKMMEAMKQHKAEIAAKAAKGEKTAPEKAAAPKKRPKVTAGSMDISNDWYKRRQDGEQGLKQVISESAA